MRKEGEPRGSVHGALWGRGEACKGARIGITASPPVYGSPNGLGMHLLFKNRSGRPGPSPVSLPVSRARRPAELAGRMRRGERVCSPRAGLSRCVPEWRVLQNQPWGGGCDRKGPEPNC